MEREEEWREFRDLARHNQELLTRLLEHLDRATIQVIEHRIELNHPPAPPESEASLEIKRAAALALKLNHPDWSDAQIAREAGLSPAALSRWSVWKTVRSARTGGAIPRGRKLPDGSIEAEDPDL